MLGYHTKDFIPPPLPPSGPHSGAAHIPVSVRLLVNIPGEETTTAMGLTAWWLSSKILVERKWVHDIVLFRKLRSTLLEGYRTLQSA